MARIVPRSTDLAGASARTGWMIATGIVMLVAGVLALASPFFVTLTATIFFGWLLLIAGIAAIVTGIGTRRAHGRVSEVLFGILSVLVAASILYNPLGGAISLTFAVAVWFVVRAVVNFIAASRRRRGWGLYLLIGVADLVLAFLLLANFPYPAVTVIGMFIGISLLLAGIVTLIGASHLRAA